MNFIKITVDNDEVNPYNDKALQNERRKNIALKLKL